MRRVRRSRTAVDGLKTLLAQGLPKFGLHVIEEKQQIVDNVIETYLAEHPQNGFRDSRRNFYHYPVADTPFTVVYEFDDSELRVLFILHQRADRRRLDPADVEW
jgi:plasmid stabilization system protein ParE